MTAAQSHAKLLEEIGSEWVPRRYYEGGVPSRAYEKLLESGVFEERTVERFYKGGTCREIHVRRVTP